MIELASRLENEHLSGIIVENTFTSVPAIGSVLFSIAAPIINILPQCAIKNKFWLIFNLPHGGIQMANIMHDFST